MPSHRPSPAMTTVGSLELQPSTSGATSTAGTPLQPVTDSTEIAGSEAHPETDPVMTTAVTAPSYTVAVKTSPAALQPDESPAANRTAGAVA